MNNVLSICDGISIAQKSLSDLGIQYDNYYASEIETAAIKVTQYHFPNTIQLGDVRNINGKLLNDIKLLCGGTPCTDFSFMGKRKGMITTENIEITTLEQYLKFKNDGFEFVGESFLFWEFVRLIQETNTKYFFLENVRMTKQWENIITKTLGVEPIFINSSKLSAQNRERLYWTNIPCNTNIEDKGIMLSDIIPNAIAGAGKRGRKLMGDKHYSYPMTVRKDGKANCLVTSISNTGFYLTTDNQYLPLSVEEMEVLQTIDKGYTNVGNISNSKRVSLIGNSWTKEVIKHLFSGLKTKKNTYNLFFR
jgi:site-specific DNA-cytosine methylase